MPPPNLREAYDALRVAALPHYGGPACVGCGEDEIQLLVLAPLAGRAEPLQVNLLGRLRKAGYPPGYRVLCPNCNIRAARGIPLPGVDPAFVLAVAGMARLHLAMRLDPTGGDGPECGAIRDGLDGVFRRLSPAENAAVGRVSEAMYDDDPDGAPRIPATDGPNS